MSHPNHPCGYDDSGERAQAARAWTAAALRNRLVRACRRARCARTAARLFHPAGSALIVTLALMAIAPSGRAQSEPGAGQIGPAADPGLSIQAGLTVDALRNQAGALTRGSGRLALADLRIGLDFESLAQRPGLTGHLHLMHHAPGYFNAERVGALTGASNIETLGHGTKLYRAWIEQRWADTGRALRVGLFPFEDEFFTMDAAASFIHPTNGPQGDYAGTVGAAIYNHAGFGLRLRQEWAQRARYAMVALLDRPLEDTNFVRWNGIAFPRAPGLQLMAEIGLTPLASAEPARGERVSKHAAGIWAHSSGDPHLSARDANGQALRARSHGWYVLGERTLWAAADSPAAIAGFARLSGGDARAFPVSLAVNTGLRVSGWVPGRSADVTAVMLVGQRLGTAWRSRLAQEGREPAAAENVAEVNHRIEISRSLAMMPLAQWISRPGGEAGRSSSRVLGLRVMLSL